MITSTQAKISTLEMIIPNVIKEQIEDNITNAINECKYSCSCKFRKTQLAELNVNVNDIYKWLKLHGYKIKTEVSENCLWVNISWTFYQLVNVK